MLKLPDTKPAAILSAESAKIDSHLDFVGNPGPQRAGRLTKNIIIDQTIVGTHWKRTADGCVQRPAIIDQEKVHWVRFDQVFQWFRTNQRLWGRTIETHLPIMQNGLQWSDGYRHRRGRLAAELSPYAR